MVSPLLNGGVLVPAGYRGAGRANQWPWCSIRKGEEKRCPVRSYYIDCPCSSFST